MTHGVIVLLAALSIVGQVVIAVIAAVAVLALLRVAGPLHAVRDAVAGCELWLVSVVALTATFGSLFLSEIADFVPCELCWFQRIFMYPLAIAVPLMALARDSRAARYVVPLPFIGSCFSIYQDRKSTRLNSSH